MSDSQNKDDTHGNDDGNNRRRQVSRSEHEWREILKRANKETDRFLKLYEDSFLLPEEEQENGDRLDRCAVAMGWHLSEDEDGIEKNSGNNGESDDFSNDGNAEESSHEQDFPQIYSLHNLPECIAISALVLFAKKLHRELLRLNVLSPISAALLAETLGEAHRDMLLAVEAEDAGEFGLSICLMKNAHNALNNYLAETKFSRPAKKYLHEFALIVNYLNSVIFDLRDMCLRILRDARGEMARAKNG